MILELPNGATLITGDVYAKERIVFIMKGLSMGAEILPPNEEPPGSDAWANREIELYCEALAIDRQAHEDFIRECLFKQVEGLVK
jgi:hypothetical protein